MASGHGVDKPRTEFHPGRQVGAGSGPWTKWQVHDTGRGQQAASARNVYDRNYPHSIHADPVEGGYEAGYHHIDIGPGPSGRGREYTSRYTAGPFRSAGRAQLAAEALANRVGERGKGSKNYRSQTYE